MQLPNNTVLAWLFIIFIWCPVACVLIVADYTKDVFGIKDKDDTDYQSADEKEREVR